MLLGSHHVYVEVKDANGDSATTLTVEFNVLPTVSPSSSPTQSPTAEPTQSGTPPPYDDSFLNDNVTTPIIIGLVALAVLVGVAFVLRKHHKETKK